MAQQRTIEIRVGIFVLVCLVVVAGLIIRFGKYTRGLEKSYEITVVFPNVGGIVRDANVLYAGIPVGMSRLPRFRISRTSSKTFWTLNGQSVTGTKSHS